jgi:hypothetical protein
MQDLSIIILFHNITLSALKYGKRNEFTILNLQRADEPKLVHYWGCTEHKTTIEHNRKMWIVNTSSLNDGIGHDFSFDKAEQNKKPLDMLGRL